MCLPDDVLRIVEKAVDRHAEVNDALEEAVQAILSLPDYKQYVGDLVRTAIQRLIHLARSNRTAEFRRQEYSDRAAPKVNAFGGESVRRIYDSIYDSIFIGKTNLGNLLGRDIVRLADSEESHASGHMLNARLLRWLASQNVPADSRVRDVVKESKVRAVHKRLLRGGKSGAA